METDDLQYVTARALHALTGSPDWDDHTELAIKTALGPEAVESPAALVARLDPAWVEQVLAQAGERKHASHDQSSHGSWARGGFRTVASVDDIDVMPGRVYHASTQKIEGDRLKTPGADEIIASLMASGYTQEQAEEEGWRGENVFAFATPSDEYGQYIYELEPLGDDPWGPDDVGNGGVTLKPDAHRITRRFLVDPTEVKHGGPGPHSSGTPQAIHGSWAERLGSLIGLPDEMIDRPADRDDDGPGLHWDDPKANVVAEAEGFLDQIILDGLLPEPDFESFDTRDLQDALDDSDHPAHQQSVEVLWGIVNAEAGEIEDLGEVWRNYDDFTDAVIDLDMQLLTPEEIADLPEEDLQEYEDEIEHLTAVVEGARDDVVYSLPEHVAMDITYADAGSVRRWVANNMGSIEKATWDPQYYVAESFLQSEAVARALKNEVASRLARSLTEEQADALNEAYGASGAMRATHGPKYAAASQVVGAWAQSSNDEHAPSLLMQDNAAEHFGLHRYSTWEHSAADAKGAARIRQRGMEDVSIAQRTLLQAMYDATQEHFEEKGITHVRLHRGMQDWDGKDRPLSSWSVSDDTASNFAGWSGSQTPVIDHDKGPVERIPEGSVIRAKTFPVEQIVSCPGLGFGCFSESEFVVLANRPFSGPAFDPEDQLRLPGSDEWKHAGPGPHPGTGTPQAVHTVGGRGIDWDVVMDLSPVDAKDQVMRSLADSIRGWDPEEMDEWLRFQQGYFLADTDAARHSDDPHERMAATLISSWAYSSNDADPVALNLQTAAEREFGIKGAPWRQGAGERTVPEGSEEDGHLRAFLRAQYDATQALLEREGADEVRLYRGGWFDGDADVRMRPMSSWSYDEKEAEVFAIESEQDLPFDRIDVEPDAVTYPTWNDHPIVYAQTVPHERILSTALTGFGAMKEGEMVVLAEVPAEFKHASHDQMSHGRRYGRLAPGGDKMKAFPDLPVKVHRGLLLSRSGSPERALELVRQRDDIGYGRHWAEKPETAEKHALGVHNLSAAWVFGKKPDEDGAYGVVVTAHMPEGTEVRDGTAATRWAMEDEVDLPKGVDARYSYEVWHLSQDMERTRIGLALEGGAPEKKHADHDQMSHGNRYDVNPLKAPDDLIEDYESSDFYFDVSEVLGFVVDEEDVLLDPGELLSNQSEVFTVRDDYDPGTAPPIEVVEYDGDLWIWDGVHRALSARQAGSPVRANVMREEVKHVSHNQKDHGNRFTGPTVHRGIVIPDGVFPTDEVNDLLDLPMTEEEIGKDMGVGKVILDALAEGPEGMGLGRSWSHRKQVAETAQGPGVKVVLTAETREGDEDLGTHAGYNVSSEDEWTAGPGSKVRVTGVYLYDYYDATRGKNYLDEPVVMDAWRGPGVDETKHMGPGPHPSGSPQAVHSGSVGKIVTLADLQDRLVRRAIEAMPSEEIPVDFTRGIEAYERMKEFSDPEAMEVARARAEQAWTKAVEGRITRKEREEMNFAMRFGMIPVELESLEGEERTPLPEGPTTYEVPLDPDDDVTRFMKANEIPEMAERAMEGMEPEDRRTAEAILHGWARHPSQHGGRLLMRAAREEFGLTGAAFTPAPEGVPDPDEERVARDLVRRLKAESEATFEPGESVVLWRAVQGDLQPEEGKPYQTRPIESWSTEPDSAEFFAMVPEGEGTAVTMGEDASIIKVVVPADRILSIGVPGAELQETLVIGEEITPDRVFKAKDFEGYGMTDWEAKHAGPGPHPGTGSPQAVHNVSMGPAMKALTKMLADPDWRLFRRYNSTPSGIAIESGLEQQISDLGFTPNEIEELALAETRAYKEFFDRPDSPNVRVERVQVKVKKSDGYDGYREEWDPRVFVYPDPEGTRVARLPSRGKHYGLHAVWDDDEGKIVGWEVDDPYTYDTEFETNPVEIARTKHLLDSTDKYDDLHKITKRLDATDAVWRIRRHEPQTEEEERAKKDLLDYAWQVHRDGAKDVDAVTPLVQAAQALDRLEAARARPDDEPEQEVDELDELLGVAPYSVPKGYEVRTALEDLTTHARRTYQLREGKVEPDFDSLPLVGAVVVEEQTSPTRSQLKRHVAKQVAQGWEDRGYEHAQVSSVLQSAGIRREIESPEGSAGEFIGVWASTSNDEHDVSLAIQDAAEREFALDKPAGWHKQGPSLLVEDEEVLDVTLRDMYARTQRMFEEEGITEVRAYRGQGVPADWDGRMRPMASWSVDKVEASYFVRNSGPETKRVDVDLDKQDADGLRGWDEPDGGTMLSATIPVNRILCTPKTGFGCLGEFEIVVLGGPLEDMVKPLHGEAKHMGPGPHPSGTPQLVHRGGGVGYSAAVQHLSDLLVSDNDRTRTIAGRLFEKFTGGIPEQDVAHGTLDLEWMGQFAPIKAGPDVETTTRRAREYLRTLPTYDESDEAHEQGVTVLKDGSILDNAIYIGAARSIPTRISDYRGKDVAVQMHNHPRADTSLSVGDVQVGIHTKAPRAEAVTRSGAFALEIDHDELEAGFGRKADSVAMALKKFSSDAFHDGDLTEEQARYGTGVAMIRVLLDSRPEAFSYTLTGDVKHVESEMWPDEVLDEFLTAVHRDGPLS